MDGFSFLLLLCISLPVAVSQACPFSCVCRPSSTEGGGVAGYVVNCEDASLTRIPTGLSTNTTELILSRNYIRSIRNELQNLTNLKVLRLDYNFIDSITEGAFRTLTRLEELYLNKNCIHVLKTQVFHGLSSLRILNLSGNDMESIQEGAFNPLNNIVNIDLGYNRLVSLPDEAFKDLSKLERLIIRNNSLIVLGHEAFCNLSRLSYLNLDSNLLTTIPESSVYNLPSLETLILMHNRIVCDCDARWLYQWLISNRLSSPECAGPPSLDGNELTKLFLSEFCNPPFVNLTLNGSTIWTVGSDVILKCPNTGMPAPDILWTRNETRLSNSSRLSITESQLMIADVGLSDAGDYQCIASSSAGIAVSNKITSYVIDLMMEMLDGINAILGNRVVLPCTTASELVLNLNSSQVVWLKDGSLLTYNERHVLLPDGSIVLVNVTYADAGSYSCQLEGMLNINRTLIVRGPPRIVSFPQEMCDENRLVLSLYSDVSYNLTCEATGNPMPNMIWFDGNRNPLPIIRNENVIIHELNSLSTRGGQRLTYICNVSNDLGGDERNITVSIKDRTIIDLTDINFRSSAVGDLVTLMCNPPGLSDINRRRWAREDGRDLPSNSQITFFGLSLLIYAISLEDSGVYNCFLDTDMGVATVQYNITVEGSPAISSMCAIPTLVSVLGTNVSLNCPVTGNPPPVIQWFINGIPISNVSSFLSYMLNDSNMTLTLFTPPAERNSFTCQAVNSLGNDSYTVILSVEGPPTFVQKPSSLRVNASEIAVFHCSGEGNPKPVLKWWTIREGWPFEIKQEDTERIIISDERLVILKTFKSDAGEYYCTLNSSVDNQYISIASHIVHLTVWVFPTLSDDLPTELATFQRHPITLPCGGSGDPRPAIVWYKDGTRLPIDGQHYQLSSGNLRILDPMKNRDDGVYTCRVVNVAGSVYHNINLTIFRSPNITITPANITTIEGCTALFTCLDSGDPPLNVTWFLGDKPLVNSSETIIRPNGDLILVNVNGSDTGLYTCQMVGATGPYTFNNATLFVIEMERNITGPVQQSPIIRTFSSQELSLPPGGNATFVCLSTGLPLPTTSWSSAIGNDTLSNSSRVFVTEELLIIYNVTPSDSGLYQCTSVNMLGETMIIFSLTVSVPPSASISSDVNVTEGDTIKMKCRSIGVPTPSLTWHHNGSLVNSGEHVSITVEESGEGDRGGVSSLLVIANASLSDAGSYACSANNTAGFSEYTQTVLVAPIIITFPPSIQSQLQSLMIRLGDPLSLNCTATARPTPLVQWTKDGVPVESVSNSIGLYTVSENIIIMRSSVSDSGTYVCTADNAVGTDSYSVQVNISALPSFIVRPEPMSVLTGADIIIECLASGLPTPSVKWVRLNKTDSTNATVSNNGSLIINNSTLSDTGDYVCVATNIVGINTAQIPIEVKDPTALPSFIVRLKPESVLTGADIMIECIATGLPTPSVKWVRLNGTDSTNTTVSNNGILIINNSSLSDTGDYVCVATNIVGINTAQIPIEVKDPTALPSLIVRPQPESVLTGADIIIECIATGLPTPSVKWVRLNKTDSTNATVSNNGSLIINNSTLSDTGDYVCVATNIVGKNTAQIPIEVKDPTALPSFIVRLKPESVLTGADIMIECIATGLPTPSVKWVRLNGTDSTNTTVSNNGILIINNSSLSDTGDYVCVATNIVGINTAQIPIEVKDPTALPSLIVRPQPESVLTGADIIIECIATGLPTPSVKWVRLNKTDSTNATVSNNGSLIINNSTLSDTGDYVCVATNIVGKNTAQIPIEVKDPTEVPVLRILPDCIPCCNREFSIPIGVQPDTSFDCQASGLPPPQYNWFINGTNVSEIDPARYEVLSNGTLVILRVSSSDDGTYRCLASNIVGTSAAHFGASFRITIAGTSEDMVVLTRSNIVLSCGAHNDSYWKYNGSVIIVGEVQRDDGSLEIHGVSSLHAGEYTCIYNKTGRLLTHTIFLRVQERKEPPYFISLLNDTQVLAGRTLSLDCHVTGPTGHIMINWYHNDIRLSRTDEVFITDDNRTLTLFGISFMWSGNFTCSAENQYGMSTSAAHVQVHERVPDEHLIVLHNSYVDLDCSEYSNEGGEGGGGIMEWRYNRERLQSSEGYSISAVLKLHDVSLSNQGDYTCLVAGIVKKLFFVEVVVPPFIVNEATNKSVILNISHRNLDCPYYGKPFPLVQWRHNSTLIDLSSKYSVFHNGTLVIYKINPHTDGGTYSCTAVNSYGRASLSYEVNIQRL